MAEQASSTALMPAPAELGQTYSLQIKEFTAGGGSQTLSVPVPANLTSREASVMLRAAILKNTTWASKSLAVILHAVIYADNYGLDIMAGDVYMAEEGRLSTTAGAKIRHAMSTERIKGYEVTIEAGEPIQLKYSTQKGGEQTWEGTNLHAKVVVQVAGWDKPVVYETTLAEWFIGRNPNWRSRPAYMLRRNALSKALEEVAPLGVEADEAPPLNTIEFVPTQSKEMK